MDKEYFKLSTKFEKSYIKIASFFLQYTDCIITYLYSIFPLHCKTVWSSTICTSYIFCNFRLNTGDIGATAGEDYTSIVNREITIPTTTTQISETILISNDQILENDETFSVTVTSLSTPHLAAVDPEVTVVTITDNDSKGNSNGSLVY